MTLVQSNPSQIEAINFSLVHSKTLLSNVDFGLLEIDTSRSAYMAKYADRISPFVLLSALEEWRKRKMERARQREIEKNITTAN